VRWLETDPSTTVTSTAFRQLEFRDGNLDRAVPNLSSFRALRAVGVKKRTSYGCHARRLEDSFYLSLLSSREVVGVLSGGHQPKALSVSRTLDGTPRLWVGKRFSALGFAPSLTRVRLGRAARTMAIYDHKRSYAVHLGSVDTIFPTQSRVFAKKNVRPWRPRVAPPDDASVGW